VVPLSLPGFQIQRDEALAEQTVAGPMTAVNIARGQLYRDVYHSELFIDADLSPHAGIAGVFCGTFLQPGVVAELADSRNRVKDPQTFAGLDVESANVARHVFRDLRRAGRSVCGANDHGIAGHD